jgi:hypothetical protein
MKNGGSAVMIKAARSKFLAFLSVRSARADSSCYYKDMDPIMDGSCAAVGAARFA